MKCILPTILLASLFSTSCAYFITTEIHLIPFGTKGDVFIIENNRDGIALNSEWGAKIYQIPSSRILVTSEPRAKYYRPSWYYLRDDGRRERLEYQNYSVNDTPENRADKRPFVWFERDAEGNLGLPCGMRFRQYYVGTRADLIARGVDGANAEELQFNEFVKENASIFCEQ